MQPDDESQVTLPFLAQVALAFFCVFIAATLLFECSGCASAKPPDPLVAGIAVSNASADALASAKADEERGFKGDLLARLAKCPTGDKACHQVAAQEALAAHGSDSNRLTELAQLQHLIGSALQLAKECRAAKQAKCEADALLTVASRMPELQAGLDLLTQGIAP